MSVGPLGTIGSIAASPLTQATTADVGRIRQEQAEQARQISADRQADNASGLGEMGEDQKAGDRDADGRRLWEPMGDRPQAPEEADPSGDEPHRSKDASHSTGNNLDLSG